MAEVTETRTVERIKKTGEVFTPPELVNEILDKLPPEVFTDPTKTFCDPACGDGNFLIEVIKRKMQNGSTALEAVSTTFGVELMQDNVDDCKRRILDLTEDNAVMRYIVDTNIVCANSLEYDFSFLPPDDKRSNMSTTELLDDLLIY